MKKIAVIFLALALALTGIGTAYALWDKNLDIYGTVHTGEVNMEIVSAASDDPGVTIDRNPFGIPDPKHVGATEVVILPSAQELEVTVTNAYPYYEAYVHFTAVNTGTVPVKLNAILIDNPNPCITVDAWNGIGEQVDPGRPKDNTMYVRVEQCAEELAQYTFTVAFWYVQWNEYPQPIP